MPRSSEFCYSSTGFEPEVSTRAKFDHGGRVTLSDTDIGFAVELFESLGNITTRKMMGGLCLYADAQIFAIVDRNGQIYVRAKGPLADDLAAAGARQFGRMGYWSLPDAALDDPDNACDWARRTLNDAED